MIFVYYDGKCGLCSKEINHYRKIAPDGLFDWHDVTESAEVMRAEGINLVDSLRLLHAKDDNGKVHVGVDAFILIWTQLKYWSLLAVFISLPLFKQVVGIFYKAFANWRFNRLSHCQLVLKNEKNTTQISGK